MTVLLSAYPLTADLYLRKFNFASIRKLVNLLIQYLRVLWFTPFSLLHNRRLFRLRGTLLPLQPIFLFRSFLRSFLVFLLFWHVGSESKRWGGLTDTFFVLHSKIFLRFGNDFCILGGNIYFAEAEKTRAVKGFAFTARVLLVFWFVIHWQKRFLHFLFSHWDDICIAGLEIIERTSKTLST